MQYLLEEFGENAIYTAIFIISAYLLVINIIGFAAMCADKRRSVRGGRRTPEKTLMTIAALFGAAGVYAAMRLKRHKTLHKKFSVGVPIMLILQIGIIAFLTMRIFKLL